MSRRGSTKRKWLSFLLIVAGAALLFQGGRIVWESHWGQFQAGRHFEQLPPAPDREPEQQLPSRPVSPVREGETVGRLIIPRLDAEVYVVEGTNAGDLRVGPGHMTGTVMPGEAGNSVIAGHRDTHFRVLKDIKRGDDIVLQTRDGEFLYRVKDTDIVSPKNTSSLNPSRDPILHLITCYPFYYAGHAPKRFIVEARLAGAVSASLAKPKDNLAR